MVFSKTFGRVFEPVFEPVFGDKTGGGGPFDPLSISNIISWYDPAQDVVTVGNDVLIWSDQSANVNHLTQDTAGRFPFYDTTTETVPFILTDGVGDLLRIASYAGGVKSYPLTFAFAAQAVTNKAIDWVFATGTGIDDTDFIEMTTNWQMFGSTGFNVGGVPDLAKHIFILTYNGNTSEFVKDGGTTTFGNVGINTQDGIILGSRSNLTSFANYKYYDFAIYNKALTIDEKNSLGNFFKDKNPGFSWTDL